MSIEYQTASAADAQLVDAEIAAQQATDLMLSVISDGLDHPELWRLIPSIVAENPLVPQALLQRSSAEPSGRIRLQVQLLLGLAMAAVGPAGEALASLMPLCATESQNVQVQGVLFHLEGLLDPENPKYQLAGKICLKPFIELDVLENSTHLCCASWLPTSTGHLAYTPGQAIWNGGTAQAIRASMLDAPIASATSGLARRSRPVGSSRPRNSRSIRDGAS